MEYQTFQPCTELSDFIKCFWTLEAPANNDSEKQRIVPDGCMEMIFHYGDLFKQYLPDGSNIIQPRCFVFGQVTSVLEIAPTGPTGILAVRFHPDGFIPFSCIPIHEMENRAISLPELFGAAGSELEAKVLKSLSTAERIAIIERFLLGKLSTSEAADRIAKASVEVLLQLKGEVSVNELAEQLKINRRQLERKFSSTIGLSPKQFSKIIRLQATLKMMGKGEYANLTAVAYENGYFDQAHFIKDFKEFTGISPKQFYAGNLRMSALFTGSE
jgi:AraC-like DNA-binding protein